MNLQLSLKQNWFEMTKERVKTEDYRAITSYFCNKFLLYKGERKSKEFWQDEFLAVGTIEDIVENIELFTTFKPFTTNIMTLGYPKKTDLKKFLFYEHKGIEIRKGYTEWGAETNTLYFVIKHGEPKL